MSSVVWDSLKEIKCLVSSDEFFSSARKVDSMLNAVAETVADTLPSSTTSSLREGAEAAITALNSLRSKEPIDRLSVNFIAGRLATVADVLGYAAVTTADETAIEGARQQPYARILQTLYDAPLRNIDLGNRLGLHKSQISRYMSQLRDMEMVTSHQSGREVFNALTPVARLVVEEGVQQQFRVPVEQNNVYGMKAYTLAGRVGPQDAQSTTPPLVRACGP